MFFGRVYLNEATFQPSLKSFATYAAIAGFILVAFEFNLLSASPGNRVGNALMGVPMLYLFMSVIFLIADTVKLIVGYFKRPPTS